MATTSPMAAVELLDRLRDDGFPAALLHGSEQLAAGQLTSDLDLVCRGPLAGALARLEVTAGAVRLKPVLLWPYDVNAVTVIVARPDDGSRLAAVQVDLLADPEGLGKYGLRTEQLLDDAVPSAPFPCVSPLDRALYLWRKSLVKKQLDRQRSASEALARYPAAVVRSRTEAVFSWGPTPVRDDIRARRSMRLRRTRARVQRLLWRALNPVGVELDDIPEASHAILRHTAGDVFPHIIERRGSWPFALTLASRRPLLALSVASAKGADVTLGTDQAVETLYAVYRTTVSRYTRSRLTRS